MLEVRVLYSGLDGIKRSGNRDGGNGARDRGDKVLRPRRFVVVCDAEQIVFCDRRRAEQLQEEGTRQINTVLSPTRVSTHRKTSRRISGHGPTPPAVQRRTLLEEYPNDSPTPERLRVHLALNLERVEGQ